MNGGPDWEAGTPPEPASPSGPAAHAPGHGPRRRRAHPAPSLGSPAADLALLFAGPGALLTAATGIALQRGRARRLPRHQLRASSRTSVGHRPRSRAAARRSSALGAYFLATIVAGVLASIGALAFSAVVAADYHARRIELAGALRICLRRTPSALAFIAHHHAHRQRAPGAAVPRARAAGVVGAAGRRRGWRRSGRVPRAGRRGGHGGGGGLPDDALGAGLPGHGQRGHRLRARRLSRSWHLSGDNVWRIFFVVAFARSSPAPSSPRSSRRSWPSLLVGVLAPALGLDETRGRERRAGPGQRCCWRRWRRCSRRCSTSTCAPGATVRSWSSRLPTPIASPRRAAPSRRRRGASAGSARRLLPRGTMGAGEGASSGSMKTAPRPCWPNPRARACCSTKASLPKKVDLGLAGRDPRLQRLDLRAGAFSLRLDVGRARERAREDHDQARGHEQAEHDSGSASALERSGAGRGSSRPSLESDAATCQTRGQPARLPAQTERMVVLLEVVAMRLHQPLPALEALERFLSEPGVAEAVAARRVLPAREADFAAPARVAGPAPGQGHRAAWHQRAVQPPARGSRRPARRPRTSSSSRPPRRASRSATTCRCCRRSARIRPRARSTCSPPRRSARTSWRSSAALAELAEMDLSAAVYDGDTPAPIRAVVREAGQVVVTNPDMLSTAVLPHHTKWFQLFEQLRYIVIDEAHTYRGIFGSHVANVLRRLLRICEHYGSNPRIVCSSATVGNPGELAETLTGRRFRVIDQSGAPPGERHVVVLDPPPARSAQRCPPGPALALLPGGAVLPARRPPDHRLRAGARGRGAAAERRCARPCARVAGPSTASGATAAATCPTSAGPSSPVCAAARCWAWSPPTPSSWASTSARSTPPSWPATRAPSPAPGSRWDAPGAVRRPACPSSWPAPVPSTATWPRIPQYLFEATPEEARLDPENVHVLLAHLRAAAFELPFAPGETLRLGAGRRPAGVPGRGGPRASG